jgi:hypothetical protein
MMHPDAPQEMLAPSAMKLSELIGALSYALDITEGQPAGHCVRCCWIGMHIGRVAGLNDDQLWELYYTLLLKDLGCSSNAARICELYLTDDLDFKRSFKTVGDSLPQVLGFVLKHTGLKAGLAERFRSVMTILRDGPEIAQGLIATRCQRGADIARLLRFPEGVAEGIYSLDEHVNGKGKPAQLVGDAIPVYARIALLAQVIDVFHTDGGREAALHEATARAGSRSRWRMRSGASWPRPTWTALSLHWSRPATKLRSTKTTSTISPLPSARWSTPRARTRAATAHAWRCTPT